MPAEHESEVTGGLSRRQLLTRGAIAGGLVWAAPVIRTTAAYATTANGTERPCTDFFMVVINPAGEVRPAPDNPQAASVPPAIRQWFRDNPKVTVEFPEVRPLLTSTGREAWAVLLPEVDGPNAAGRQCRMVLGWARKGNSFSEGYVDPSPPIAVAVGRRLLFPCPPHAPDDKSDDTSAATGVAASDAASQAVGSDGAATGSSGSLGSDGSSSGGLSGDGTASSDQTRGAGRCIDAVYLVYCCPR